MRFGASPQLAERLQTALNSAGPVQRCGQYTSAEGRRDLIALQYPVALEWVLVDVGERSEDIRLVEDKIRSVTELDALAADYLAQATRSGEPLA